MWNAMSERITRHYKVHARQEIYHRVSCEALGHLLVPFLKVNVP